jgi:hypothetical protein
MAMKNWFIAITLVLLCAGQVHAAQFKLPAIFDGITVTPDMVKTIPAKDGKALVAIRVTVPPNAPATASPMDGYREDMWSSGQLQSLGTMTPEQSYKTLFCLVNKNELGFVCKNTAEVMSASKTKPWWIPVVVIPQAEVPKLTTMLTSGPIPPSVTRVAAAAGAGQMQRTPEPGALIPWSDAPGAAMSTAPPSMEWYEGAPPAHTARSALKSKNKAR